MKWPDPGWRRLYHGLMLGLLSCSMVMADSDRRSQTPRRAAASAAVPAKAVAPVAGVHVELERLAWIPATADADAIGNPFAAKSWYVPPPPPPPPKPAPPPRPEAPPLPFSFLGRYLDGGAVTVMLVRGDRVYTAGPGEVLDGTWRIDSIGDDEVALVYLPLNVRQTLATGGVS